LGLSEFENKDLNLPIQFGQGYIKGKKTAPSIKKEEEGEGGKKERKANIYTV